MLQPINIHFHILPITPLDNKEKDHEIH